MRLLMLLAAVMAVVSSHTRDWENLPVEHKSLGIPGFANGTILTLFFYHIEKKYGELHECLGIRFFNQMDVSREDYKNISAPAHIEFVRSSTYPVSTGMVVDGKLKIDVRVATVLDEEPEAHGWFRVDLIKLDSYFIHVFFQGFYIGKRWFGSESLDGVKSYSITTDSWHYKFHERVAFTNVTPDQLFWTFTNKNQAVRQATFPNFPDGSQLEIVAFMGTENGWTFCTISTGDLRHLRIERRYSNVLEVQLMSSEGLYHNTCRVFLPAKLSVHLDSPIDIIAHNMSLIYRAEMIQEI